MGTIRAKAIKESSLGRLISGYDVNSNNSEIDLAKSVDEIILNKDIDAIFICTPNYLNKSLTIKSLEAGKHVFCEKPPAFCAQDVIEIQKVEKLSGKKLMYGFNHRHHQSIQLIKQFIETDRFGEILWMRGRYGKSVDKSFFDSWRAKKQFAGGGILLDQGIHMLDLFLYLGGNFDEVQAMVSNLFWKLDIEDNVFATFRNSRTGLIASLHSTMTQWRHLFSLEVFFERGYCVLNGLKTTSQTYGDEILTYAKNRTTAPAATWEDEEHITFHDDKFWNSEVDIFLQAIKDNSSIPTGNSEDALRLMYLIDKIYEQKTF